MTLASGYLLLLQSGVPAIRGRFTNPVTGLANRVIGSQCNVLWSACLAVNGSRLAGEFQKRLGALATVAGAAGRNDVGNGIVSAARHRMHMFHVDLCRQQLQAIGAMIVKGLQQFGPLLGADGACRIPYARLSISQIQTLSLRIALLPVFNPGILFGPVRRLFAPFNKEGVVLFSVRLAPLGKLYGGARFTSRVEPWLSSVDRAPEAIGRLFNFTAWTNLSRG